MKLPSSSDAVAALNNRIALWTVRRVGTMSCAWLFALIALIALPEALADTFVNGFRPLALITWLSQSFLQLVLLSIIMVGQDLQAHIQQAHAEALHDTLHDKLDDHHETIKTLFHHQRQMSNHKPRQ